MSDGSGQTQAITDRLLTKSLADRLFETFLAHSVVDGELFELLQPLYPDIDDYTFDYYDRSIELYGVEPSDSARDSLHAAGFDCVWQHPHPPPRNDCKCPRQSRPR